MQSIEWTGPRTQARGSLLTLIRAIFVGVKFAAVGLGRVGERAVADAVLAEVFVGHFQRYRTTIISTVEAATSRVRFSAAVGPRTTRWGRLSSSRMENCRLRS